MLKNKINKHFKLPIFFSKNVNTIPNNIINELELIENKPSADKKENLNESIYNKLLNTDSEFNKLFVLF